MPRPSKLTPARQQTIIDTIRSGNYFETALLAAGVRKTAGYTWLDRGRTELERIEAGITDEQREQQGFPSAASERRYAEFAEAVERARAEAEVHVVSMIHKQIDGGWLKAKRKDPETGEIVEEHAGPDGKLGLEFLSRVAAPRYGRRQTIEVSGPEGAPIAIDASDGARLAERVRGFLDRVKADPKVIDVEGVEVRRELVAAPVAADRSDDAG